MEIVGMTEKSDSVSHSARVAPSQSCDAASAGLIGSENKIKSACQERLYQGSVGKDDRKAILPWRSDETTAPASAPRPCWGRFLLKTRCKLDVVSYSGKVEVNRSLLNAIL
jgi:hypothetical protein